MQAGEHKDSTDEWDRQQSWHCHRQPAVVFFGHHSLRKERKGYSGGFARTICVIACSSPHASE